VCQNKTFDTHIFFGFSRPILLKLWYSRVLHPIVQPVCTDVSEKRTASMFSVPDHHLRFDIKFTQ